MWASSGAGALVRKDRMRSEPPPPPVAPAPPVQKQQMRPLKTRLFYPLKAGKERQKAQGHNREKSTKSVIFSAILPLQQFTREIYEIRHKNRFIFMRKFVTFLEFRGKKSDL